MDSMTRQRITANSTSGNLAVRFFPLPISWGSEVISKPVAPSWFSDLARRSCALRAIRLARKCFKIDPTCCVNFHANIQNLMIASRLVPGPKIVRSCGLFATLNLSRTDRSFTPAYSGARASCRSASELVLPSLLARAVTVAWLLELKAGETVCVEDPSSPFYNTIAKRSEIGSLLGR